MQLAFLQPMFDNQVTVLGMDPMLVIVGLAVFGLIIGFVLIHRATGGEAQIRPFRATDPPRRGILDAMHGKRTRAWYLTRIELAIGFVAGAVLLAFIVLVAIPGLLEPRFDPRPRYAAAGILAAAVFAMLFGLAWMIRIYRGPADEPPPWRYRDH